MRETLPNPENATLEEIETAMECTKDGKMCRRLQAIGLLLEGRDKADVVAIIKKSIQSLNKWIKAFNERGIDGLITKPKSGRPKKINEKESRKIQQMLKSSNGKDKPYLTIKRIHGIITDKWQKELGYSTLLKHISEKGYRRVVPRRWPALQDKQKREEFLLELEDLYKNGELEIWFGDETGIEADPRPKRVWAAKGERPLCPFSGNHIRESVVGAVCPKIGELFCLMVPFMNKNVFQIFLNHLAEATENRKILLILDNATWHKSSSLNWHHIKVLYLPAYSPDLNPIENLWMVLKERYFKNFYTKVRDELKDQIQRALRAFIYDKNEVKSICNIESYF